MKENNEAVRVGVYLNQHLIDRCDATAKMRGISRSELIRDALEYYIAVLSAKESGKVLSPALESVINSRIALTEDRINRIIFKLGVEVAMMNNLMAAKYNINNEIMQNLRQMCTKEVASIGGKYSLEDAIQFQRGDS